MPRLEDEYVFYGDRRRHKDVEHKEIPTKFLIVSGLRMSHRDVELAG